MPTFLVALVGCDFQRETTPELEDGTIVVSWQVGASGCEAAGVDQVVVAVGDETATFACDDGQGTFDVPPGLYDVHLDGVDVQGAVRYGGDTSVRVGSGQTAEAPTVVLGALPAELTVTWFFENGRLCSANGVEEVELTVFEDDFVVRSLIAPCDDGAATVDALVAGTYDVSLLGRDAAQVAVFAGVEAVDLGKGELVVMEIQLVAN